MKYTIAWGRADNLCEATQILKNEVDALLQQGWLPQGGVAVVSNSRNTFYDVTQAMTKG